MKRLILTFLFLSFLFQLHSQTNHWTSSNLRQNGVTEVYSFEPISESKVYLTSNQGLCIFDLVLNQYDTCFNLPLKNYSIHLANSICWVELDSGIARTDGQSIVTFGSTQGVPSDTIHDMAVNSQGQLWVTTPQGIAYYSNGAFSLDTTMELKTLVFDSLDRLIGSKSGIVLGSVNLPAFNELWARSNNSWNSYMTVGVDSGEVIRTSNIHIKGNGQLVYSEGGKRRFYTLQYPANFQYHPLVSQLSSNFIMDLEVDRNNRIWSGVRGRMHLHSTLDSILKPHFLDNYDHSKYINIKAEGNSIMVLNDCKLYSASNTIESNGDLEKEIEVNTIRTQASVMGPLFHNASQNASYFEFPKGNNTHGIFAGNIILVTKKSNDTAFQVNQVQPYNAEFKVGPTNTTDGLSGEWIIKVSRQQILNHQNNYNSPNYQMPSSIANWKGNGDVSLGMVAQLAPYEDLNGNGIYEPHLGDYPKIKGDEAIYWINHIEDIEYHGMLYGYDRPNDTALNQSLFLSYEIFNRANVSIDSAKMGLWMDFDLGNPADDLLGSDSLENVFFVYNGDSLDEPFNGYNGFGVDIPFLGTKFLSDSLDGFSGYRTGGGLNGTPTSAAHYLYLMSPNQYYGTTQDSLNGSLREGLGIGHIPWFSLQPNQSKTIEMVIGYAQVAGGGQLGSKTTMLNYLDSAQSFWESNIATSLYEPLKTDESPLLIYPNPTESHLVVELKGFKSATLQQPLQIYNLQGRLIREVHIRNRRTVLNVTELDQGIYILRYGNQVQKLVKQ